MVQRVGRMSMATTSRSQDLPISRNTDRVSIITAGSLVLMPFRSGITFS